MSESFDLGDVDFDEEDEVDTGDDDDDFIDEICNEIAEDAVSNAIDYMFGSCVNEGQESLVGDVSGEFEDQAENIADGEFYPVSSEHPEAIGLMVDVANEICASGAHICGLIRAGEQIGNILF